MIITTVRHGRTCRDSKYLVAHLAKTHGQVPSVWGVGNCPCTTDPADVVTYMERLRDLSRSTVAYLHLSLNPRGDLDDNQVQVMIDEVTSSLGAADHAWMLVRHAGKSRAVPGGGADHYHLVLANVGPDGRAINDSWSYVRLEAVARRLEVAWGEPLTPSRLAAPVAGLLDEQAPVVGRAVRQLALGGPLPDSAMTSRGRAAAARQGIDLPSVRAHIATLWRQSDGPAAFRAALQDAGMSVVPGRKPGKWIIQQSGHDVGSLDRLLHLRLRDVANMMEAVSDRKQKGIALERKSSDVPQRQYDDHAQGGPAAAGAAERGEWAGSDLRAPGGDLTGPTAVGQTTRRRVDAARAARELAAYEITPAARQIIREIRMPALLRWLKAPARLIDVLQARRAGALPRIDRLRELAAQVVEHVPYRPQSVPDRIRDRIRARLAERQEQQIHIANEPQQSGNPNGLWKGP